ncbi:MAG: glycosyl transferase [Caulobacteraceae bacterium]|nr:glycosyl transferase [Caulobacteraceae bacterium]
MTALLRELVIDNGAWAKAQPALSVLIPFFRDDPYALIAALDREQVAAELVLLDDGGGDAELVERVTAAVQAAALPARLVSLSANEGRAKGRNRLARHGRADRLLFLDSDMLPDTADFLARWIDVQAQIAFGGFTLDQTPEVRRHALHRHMALRSDCVPAAVRALQPEKHVFTSNLLVSRAVFAAIAFDEAFAGWGWEDVEWAMRAAKTHPILHIDNTASHLGLDEAATLARKYAQSAANFALVVAAHPALVETFPSYRIARLLKRLPLRAAFRGLFKRLALAAPAPLRLRDLSMRLYRASLYAEVV